RDGGDAVAREFDGADEIGAALSGEGEAGDLSVSGGWTVAFGDIRLEAQACGDARGGDARKLHQGAADRAASGAAVGVLRAAAQVSEVRQIGAGNLRAVSADR